MMTNQLQILRVKLKDSNVIVIYYYKSNVAQQFGQQAKKHYRLYVL